MDGERFGRAVSPRELEALGAESSAAARVLQRCVAEHHVAEVDYTDLHLKRETLRVRPAVISVNSAGHVVLWCMPVGIDEWRELLLDRVARASDTGEGFTPPWPDR